MRFVAQDARRLLESNADRAACADPTKLTDSVALQAALTEALGDLEVADGHLRTTILAVIREAGETAEDRDALTAASARADAEWTFVRGEVERGLLNPDPRAMPDATTLTRRRAVFAQVLAPSKADFERLAPDTKAQTLRNAADVAAEEPNRKVLGTQADLIIERFQPLATEIDGHRKNLQREVGEDREAYERLFAARAAFDRAYISFALLVDAALNRAGRRSHLGRYLRAQDPAYRARRVGNRPMKEEEGIEAITTALGTTPHAIEEAPAPG